MRIVLFLVFFATCLLNASIDNKKVFVVANMLDRHSVELAKSYCKYRAIPEKNIILLDIPKNTGIVSRDFYVHYIENILFLKLIELGAINALDLKSNDSYGRGQLILSRINLDYLVLCKGIPWGVSDREKSKRKAISFANSDASVDSEISARFLPSNKYKGFMKNPAFAKTGEEWRLYGLIRVARLDGASFDDVKKMLQNTQDVESRGIVGRAYFDKCKRAKLGDDWIDSAAKILKEHGFDISIDESRTVMNLGHRMDYPAL
ncbi:MAG: TIGR03790 family protein [Opitutales bacterium]|nr:TIGR03790 family protein [Opitutales bacterium]